MDGSYAVWTQLKPNSKQASLIGESLKIVSTILVTRCPLIYATNKECSLHGPDGTDPLQ